MTRKDRIEIDFARALSQADQLEQISIDLSSMAKTRVEKAMGLLDSHWNGENARLFIKKGENLIPDLIETAEYLKQMAANIRFTADKIYSAEMQAVGQFRARAY